MNTILRFFKQLFCEHDFRFNRNIYGDEINNVSGKRSEWQCHKCSKLRYQDQLFQKLKLIIAGNYNQFRQYCRKNKLNPPNTNKVSYVYREDQLYGLRHQEVELIFIGEYHNNPVYKNSDRLKIIQHAQKKLHEKYRILPRTTIS